MLRIVVLPLFMFLFSMACMGQTFQYSRGWTNGKRTGGAVTTLNNLFRKDDEGLSELFEAPDTNERKLERCLLQIQRLLRNPLLLNSSTGAALAPTSQNGNGNRNKNNDNDNNNNINNLNNNPYGRSHQSNDLFEEMVAGGGAIIDSNDYVKH